jgi:diguanylate cyclase (GGDEF)-like protein/PAS domain S-box-containing protein
MPVSALALLQATLDASPDGVAAIGLQGELLAFNPHFGRIWHIPKGMLDRADSAELWQLCNQQVRSAEHLPPWLAPGQHTELELHDGRFMERHVSSIIHWDAHALLIVYWRDSTARRRAEQQLQETQSFMGNLLEVAPVSIFVTGRDHRLRLVNRQWEYDTATPRADALGRRMEEVFPVTLAQQYATENLRVLDSGQQQAGEGWADTPNGRRCYYTIKFPVHNRQGQAETVGGISIDITDRKNAEAQVQSLAFSDQLTGLPNRRLLLDRLEQAMATCLRHGHHGALLFIDLDNFKTLNDTYGHEMGDHLLQQVAHRLVQCLRDCDTVARLGGDEFVVMLTELDANSPSATRQVQAAGEKILAVLNQVYQLGDTRYHVTSSVGATLFGLQAEGLEEPLKRADMAMYHAKAAGRNTLRCFDPAMQATVQARSALEMGLREALTNGEFQLYYQPQMLGTQLLTGAEALVRWLHPQRGMVSPAEFIPLAEESGLILPLGLWVLHTACTQLAQWAEQPALASLTLSVNVSPRQFRQTDFVEQVMRVLQCTGANPQRLKLELTESLLVDSITEVGAKMDALKHIGVGFSLDDFGTGYSSLSHLKLLPLEQIKIDQSFVKDLLTDPNDAAIACMVVTLANSLDVAVIAEGVETEAQRGFLAQHGCHACQGYLFSRPLPLAAFEAWARPMLQNK